GARLQRHAAFGAIARPVLHDLRMHRAGVFHPRDLGRFRLQCHATIRAVSRALLTHLGMHGAGIHVVRAMRCRLGAALVGPFKDSLRVGLESPSTALATEVPGLALVYGVMIGIRADVHAAYRVPKGVLGRGIHAYSFVVSADGRVSGGSPASVSM